MKIWMLERNHSSGLLWPHVKSEMTSGLINFAYMCRGLSVICILQMLDTMLTMCLDLCDQEQWEHHKMLKKSQR